MFVEKSGALRKKKIVASGSGGNTNGRKQNYGGETNGREDNSCDRRRQSGSATGDERLFEDAGRFVIEREKASIGMLQRNFRIGFNRAGRIIDQLSEAGVVGPDIGTKPRKVLITMQEFDELLSKFR